MLARSAAAKKVFDSWRIYFSDKVAKGFDQSSKVLFYSDFIADCVCYLFSCIRKTEYCVSTGLFSRFREFLRVAFDNNSNGLRRCSNSENLVVQRGLSKKSELSSLKSCKT